MRKKHLPIYVSPMAIVDGNFFAPSAYILTFLKFIVKRCNCIKLIPCSYLYPDCPILNFQQLVHLLVFGICRDCNNSEKISHKIIVKSQKIYVNNKNLILHLFLFHTFYLLPRFPLTMRNCPIPLPSNQGQISKLFAFSDFGKQNCYPNHNGNALHQIFREH